MDPNPNEPDRAFEAFKVTAPLDHAGKLELFKSVIESGQTALRSLMLINGGASVAVLALLGNLRTKDPPPTGLGYLLERISLGALIFVFGVGFAGAALAARYLNAWALLGGSNRFGKLMNWVAIGLGLLSLAAFFEGGWKSYCALRK